MPGSADFVQKAVHTLEAGVLAPWIKRGLIAAAIIGLAVYHLYYFRGLATAAGMDQAQIGREIASFHGWRTNVLRPRALGQLLAHGKPVARIEWDTYEAPLPPLLDAAALFFIRSHGPMTSREVIYLGDKVIAIEEIGLLLLSVLVLFFLARRLFDERLAWLACGLVLLCDLLWQYALSGLPQMAMLLVFNCTLYALVRAIEGRNAEDAGASVALGDESAVSPAAAASAVPTSTVPFDRLRAGSDRRYSVNLWPAGVGLGFGLLALLHAITFWMLAAALLFFAFYFRPRLRALLVIIAIVAALYSPWLLRNFILTGNPGGVAIYSVLDGISHSEAGHMRRVQSDIAGMSAGALRDKMLTNFSTQLSGMFGNFGDSIVALMFFVSLLHSFRNREAAALRWMLLAMWGGALAGMCVFGMNLEDSLSANQLHVLFLPIMSCFGLAWLLVQWNRTGLTQAWARAIFLAGVYLLCALPTILSLPVLNPTRLQVRWPPYLPPYIAVLNGWMQPNEIVATDMPWAVAWYAQRRALWLPETVQQFIEFNDYRTFGGPVSGIYLTPISGGQNKVADVMQGEYKDWAQLILRTADVNKFALKWATLLGLDNQCIFLSDRDRSKSP